MKKFVNDIFLFFIVFVIVSSLASLVLDKLFKGRIYSHTKHNWVLSLKDHNYDYATLGSSRVLNVVNVSLIDSLTGKHGINIATSGSSYADNYALLQLFFENGNSAKTLFLNIDEFCFDATNHYSYPFADYEYMPYFNRNSIKDIFKDYSKLYYLWNYLPFSRYAEFSDKYKLQNLFVLKGSKSTFSYSKGYEKLSDTAYITFKSSKSTLNKTSLDLKYFYKIIDLCRANNSNPVLITTPEYAELYQFQSNRSQIYDRIYKIKDSLNLKYYYFDSIGNFQNQSYFRDYTHTNAFGADIYSTKLALIVK